MALQRGFTLAELLLATLIGTVLLGISVPALSNALERTRAAEAKAALVDTVAAAVHHAVLADARTVVCPSQDGRHCSSGYDWSRGWIAFLDTDGDRERGDTDPVFRRHAALAGQVRLSSSAGRTRIVFQSAGGNAGSNVTFRLCDGRGPARAEAFVLNNWGRIRIAPLAPAEARLACGR